MIANGWEPRGSWALLLPKACSLIPSSLLDPLCLSQFCCKIKLQRKLHDKRTCLEVNFQCRLCSSDKFILLAEFLVFNLMCDFVVLPGSVHAPPGSFHLLQCAEDQVSSNHDIPHEMDRWVLAEAQPPLYHWWNPSHATDASLWQDLLVWKQVLIKTTSLRTVVQA